MEPTLVSRDQTDGFPLAPSWREALGEEGVVEREVWEEEEEEEEESAVRS